MLTSSPTKESPTSTQASPILAGPHRDVVGDVRKGLALDYLESSDLPLEEIAALLGYEDAANFNRAFRNWVGDAPGRHRSRLRAGRAS